MPRGVIDLRVFSAVSAVSTAMANRIADLGCTAECAVERGGHAGWRYRPPRLLCGLRGKK
jgi:hypothetical protein